MGTSAHEGSKQDVFEVSSNVALIVVIGLILGLIALTGWAIYAFNN